MRIFDMHTHSTESDGTLTPLELVREASELGFSGLALTDHETFGGVPEARDEAKRLGLSFIAGVELSCEFQPEMHILGYGIDINEERINISFDRMLKTRHERNPAIVKQLNGHGISISMEDVTAAAYGGIITRAHIASALVSRGYAASVAEAFEKFLLAGTPGHMTSKRITPERAIELITGAGGFPVLAHPKTLNIGAGLRPLLQDLKELGLWGIETYYSSHSWEDSMYFYGAAKEIGLYVTGGSDFHGERKPHVRLGDGVRRDCPGMEESLELLLNR